MKIESSLNFPVFDQIKNSKISQFFSENKVIILVATAILSFLALCYVLYRSQSKAITNQPQPLKIPTQEKIPPQTITPVVTISSKEKLEIPDTKQEILIPDIAAASSVALEKEETPLYSPSPAVEQAGQLLSKIGKADGYIWFYLDSINPLTGFMGNFHPMPVSYQGHTFLCAEAAYQAQKFVTDASRVQAFTQYDGEQAFKESKKGMVRKDWLTVNEGEMRGILQNKFDQNPDLKYKLLATGDAYLVEHNSVAGRDKYWSDNKDGTGQNKLGQLLMELRGFYKGTGIVSAPSQYWQDLKNPTKFQGKQTSATASTVNHVAMCHLPGCKNPVYPGFTYCSKNHGLLAKNL